jgi:hypothetical protein
MGKKLFPYIIALSALAVSASAGFYSVSGLMKLFAGAAFAVGIMAGSLEVSKLVIASLLYQYWDSLNKVLRTYLTIAAFVLILITSAGIYGFLSSAYQETANKDQITTQQIAALESKKKLFQDTRDNLLKEKQSLSELRGTLSKSSTNQYTDSRGNLVVRSNNASYKQIESASKSDEKLSSKLEVVNDSIFSIENKILQVKTNSTASSELGPLKYLSGLTGYPMDKIINWFLLVIIFVFDPLAIALVIAANFAFKHKDEPKEYPLEEKVEDMRNVVQAYDDLNSEIEQYKAREEAEEEEQGASLEEQAEHTPWEEPEQEWEIKDEDKEPYEVYTGPQEIQLTPLEQAIEAINNEKNLSEWKKKQLIQEKIYQFNKGTEGKIY